ncbi:MAG: hypothetical protein V3V16_13235 [Melioribacteraceae bacterium]
MKKKVGIIELVIFKVQNGFSENEVIEAAKLTTPILSKFDGFINRKLAVSNDGVWSDIVYWVNLDLAKTAAQKVLKDTVCNKYFSMIQQNSMQFFHLELVVKSE